MQGIPWIVYIMVPLVIGLFLFQRRRMSGALAANTDKTFGAIAARLGLQITEGDPNLNLLYFQQPRGDFKRLLSAQGQPYGRAAHLTIMDGQKTNEYIVARRITSSFGCFLEVATQASVPAFELSLREPNQYLIPNLEFAERAELSTINTGDPELDRLFVIRAVDPRIGAALTPALKLLSTQHAVHLAGEGQRIWMSFPRMALASLTYAPEEYLLALESAACGVEGRPAPASLGVPLPAASLQQPSA
jgi:hypothetical protein